MRKIFITGIGTDVGKTFVSAILVEALKADYWKPVQTGSFFATDSTHIKNWISNTESKVHPEAFLLKQYMSPHAAAELEGVNITLDAISLPPVTNKNLIVEGAGGLMVPLNSKEYVIDLIKKFDMEVILVVQNYLGSINHTLLSVDALKSRGANILGIIFNGSEHRLSYNIIQEYSGLRVLGHIHKVPEINKEMVLKLAEEFKGL